MRIDLPCCTFKNCRHNFEGNCLSRTKYNRCDYRKVKIKAIKEFAERLGRNIRINHVNGNLFVSDISYNWIIQEIDNLVEEMVGESDG